MHLLAALRREGGWWSRVGSCPRGWCLHAPDVDGGALVGLLATEKLVAPVARAAVEDQQVGLAGGAAVSVGRGAGRKPLRLTGLGANAAAPEARPVRQAVAADKPRAVFAKPRWCICAARSLPDNSAITGTD